MPHFLEFESIPNLESLLLFDPSSFAPSSSPCSPQKRRRSAKHLMSCQHNKATTTNRPAPPQHASRTQKRVAGVTSPKKSYTPNFDVVETPQSFILEGEFPGIENKDDIIVEFDDEGRLIVKGDINNSEPKKAEAIAVPASVTPEPEREGRLETKEQEKPTETPKKRRSLSPTVEEVPDEYDSDYSLVRTPSSTSSASTMGVDDTAAASSSDQPETEESEPAEKADLTMPDAAAVSEKDEEIAEPPRKMLLQERRQTSGSFSRIFKFASPVEIEGVKATLENGLLRIFVPKVVPRMRRIEVR